MKSSVNTNIVKKWHEYRDCLCSVYSHQPVQCTLNVFNTVRFIRLSLTKMLYYALRHISNLIISRFEHFLHRSILYYFLLFKICDSYGQLYTRSTFEFPSRVNLSGPTLYCIAQTLVNKADTKRTSRCNKVDAVKLQVEFTFTKGSEVRDLSMMGMGNSDISDSKSKVCMNIVRCMLLQTKLYKAL